MVIVSNIIIIRILQRSDPLGRVNIRKGLVGSNVARRVPFCQLQSVQIISNHSFSYSTGRLSCNLFGNAVAFVIAGQCKRKAILRTRNTVIYLMRIKLHFNRTFTFSRRKPRNRNLACARFEINLDRLPFFVGKSENIRREISYGKVHLTTHLLVLSRGKLIPYGKKSYRFLHRQSHPEFLLDDKRTTFLSDINRPYIGILPTMKTASLRKECSFIAHRRNYSQQTISPS